MYVIQIQVGKSTINGSGVFASNDIEKGEIVWEFTKGHDIKISPAEYNKLDEHSKKDVDKVGYLSPSTNLYVFPPKDDPARFTNHSSNNNLTAVFDSKISDEPYFISNRNIKRGEELTNNYMEFDKVAQSAKPSWA